MRDGEKNLPKADEQLNLPERSPAAFSTGVRTFKC
jgi:hypothetical protein